MGYKAADCSENVRETDDANAAKNIVLCAVKRSRSARDTEVFLAKGTGSDDGVWCVDSGCTAHMCGNENSFSDLIKLLTGKVTS